MRIRSTITIICLVLGSLAIYAMAFAHGTEKHGKTPPANAQMKKLHAMMPMFSLALAKVEAALEKGDPAAVEAEAAKMLARTPDLKMAKPHKNLKNLKTFRSIAESFESDLKETVELARKGDIAKAKNAFKKAEAKCAECHTKFQ